MSDSVKIPCKTKRCDNVLEVQVQVFSNQVSLKASRGVKFQGSFHKGVKIVCKECRKEAAFLAYNELGS